MRATEIEHYRERLLGLARRLGDGVMGLRQDALRQSGGEASGGISNAPHHLADLGTDYMEQETSLGLLEHETARLADVNAALERIDEGTFGICQRCGQEIAARRLEALPYTPHCIRCAERLERRRMGAWNE